jgi:hypothetical protein
MLVRSVGSPVFYFRCKRYPGTLFDSPVAQLRYNAYPLWYASVGSPVV